jgi:hypothetical protein
MHKLFVTLFILSSLTAQAAIDHSAAQRSVIPRKMVLAEKKNAYMKNGVFFGGEGGRGFSLTDMRHKYSPKDGIERIVLEMGDEKGLPTQQLGYFQVSVNKELKRVDIDLQQMRGAKIDQKKIETLFAKSPIVKTAKINYDPEDQGIIIQLQLVATADVEVFKVPSAGKAGRIVVDMKKAK